MQRGLRAGAPGADGAAGGGFWEAAGGALSVEHAASMRALTRSSSASAATALPAPAGASPSARSARATSPFRPATSPWRGPPGASGWGACLPAGSLQLVRLHACGRQARRPAPPCKRLARRPRGCRTAAALPSI